MASEQRTVADQAPGEPAFITDNDVEEAIAVVGGDPREAVRALLYALNRLTSHGYPRGRVVLGAAS